MILILFIVGKTFAGLDDGLIAYYPFNGNTKDESKNGNHAISYGGSFETDRFGNLNKAFHFDGSNDFINAGNSINFNFGNSLSFSVWIYPEDENEGLILNKWVNGEEDKTVLFSSNRKIRFYVYDCFNEERLYSETKLSLKQWYHVVTVFNSSEAQIYINGVLDGTLETKTNVIGNSTGNLYFGHNPNRCLTEESCSFFKGKIDDFRIYNRVISESEIQQLFNEQDHNQCFTFIDSDGDGVPNSKDNCPNTPINSWVNCFGCRGDVRYTEEDMMSIVNNLLEWDINNDKRIGLVEVLQILKDTAFINR